MTEFVKKEFLRLIDLLDQTDPRSQEYLTLLRSIESFDSLANSIDELDKLRSLDLMEDRLAEKKTVADQAAKVAEIAKDNVVPFTAPDFPNDPTATNEVKPIGVVGKFKEMPPTVPAEPPVEDKTVEEKTYEASEVRKALVDAKGNGVNVKEILGSFGAENFGALPAAKYGELMARLQEVV